MIPPFCWILLRDILQWPSPGYWDLTPWALLGTTSSGTFRKAARKMSVPRSLFAANRPGMLLLREIPYVFTLMSWKRIHGFKKLTATKQVSATKMLEIRAETVTRNGSLAKDSTFHLFFVNVPRLKKVGEHVVKPGWLETWWSETPPKDMDNLLPEGKWPPQLEKHFHCMVPKCWYQKDYRLEV